MIQNRSFWLSRQNTLIQIGRHLKKSAIAALLILLVVIPTFTLGPAISASPLASIHTYNERPGQTTFRSKQSLRDRSDRSWQVIMFKRYQASELQGLYLRLVGFPGMVVLNTQKPLKIATGASAQWTAQPELDPQTQSLPDNSNQYDISAAMADIQGDVPLQVDIPLADGGTAELVVPPFAVHEWRDLTSQGPR